MHLQPFIDELREHVLAAAENSGEDSRAIAERMTATIDAAAHLVLLEALSVAADEITVDLAPGSVEVRLRGRDPEFAVTVPPSSVQTPPVPAPAVNPVTSEGDDGGTARVTLRLPDALKQRIEEAAVHEALSVNAWLVRVIANSATGQSSPSLPPPTTGQSFTGWVR